MRIHIKVADNLRVELIEKFKLSKVSVWSALNYLTNSERAKSVRAYALAHGGSIVDQDFIPNCRTEHTKDEMIHTFAAGVQVIISKKNSSARILVDNVEQESYDDVTLDGWGNLMYHAQELSEQRVTEASRQ